jgi:hypothetical protein
MQALTAYMREHAPWQGISFLKIYFILVAPSNVFADVPSHAMLAPPGQKCWDFSEYNEDDWTKVRDPKFSSAGSFVQRSGYIENSYPAGTDTSQMFQGDTGYAMRVINGVTALDVKAEMELQLIGMAAPSIFLRGHIQGDTHSDGYNIVVYNHNGSQGINVWQYGNGAWKKKYTLHTPIHRNLRFKFGVQVVGGKLSFYIDNAEVGTYMDPDPLPAGSLGMVAIEGPSYFYNYCYTPLP